MTYYAHAAGCGPAWMKERGPHRHRHGARSPVGEPAEFRGGPWAGGGPLGGGGPRGGGAGPFGGGGGPWGGSGGPWGGGGGPWGGGSWGGGGPGGPFGGRGRKRRGDVRLALLMLLAEEPRNGYGLMQTIEERSGGRWRPSPGSVYPALSQLEDEGFVRAVPQESGRTFEITDAGRAHLAERDDATAPWEAGDGPGASRFHELRTLVPAIAQALRQVAQVGDDEQWARATEALDETRRTLYRILADESAEEAGS